MPIVSNTSPILNLAIINQLDLLREQFGQIQVPLMVLQELKVDEDRPGSEVIRTAVATGWIQPVEVHNLSIVQLLNQTLDAGESEAIALALETSAEWTLLDERDARKIAKSLGLRVTGILGILLKAKQSGDILSLKPYLEDLRQKAGFRIAPTLLSQLLEE
ncbi:DUF3368 domain-containing protein [cf. Phormidesmis sp. LEGE 11477]|uniref:DUF3368 domain-containing protein n=1 Tax=cf. Phormidesmis sp. LEGE 11477 TaxID=1828680 RepID=UPI001882E5FE|nr:DUF3368 domain-containing protein [cf. Phormidesmis sp. LEGE 11477]MBE9062501.1 DUF3368 domain-containing protein [cf. Phormidesmis sp. LEGE 11477]